MLDRETSLTPAGYTKLKHELDCLKTEKRKEITDKIREALSFGDAWGNPEYEAAKQEQAFVEGRIKSLESIIYNAKIIDSTKSGVVGFGSVVKVLDLESESEYEYTIVGLGEADPMSNRISYKSPVAQALLGHKPGEIVQAQCPGGLVGFKILNISGLAGGHATEEVS